MKYAIAQTSGKQFLVKPGQWYDVDFIKDCLPEVCAIAYFIITYIDI
jgi:ribosomal protein L21